MLPFDTRRARVGWWLFGVVLAGVVAYVAYSVIGTLVFGLFIYYATRPVYRRLLTRIDRPGMAAAVALFALALPALLLIGYTVVVAIREFQALTAVQLPEFQSELFDLVADPRSLLEQGVGSYFSASMAERVLDTLVSAADTVIFVGVGLLHLFIMVALAFYLLRDDRKAAVWFSQRFADEPGVIESYLRAVDRDLKSIFFGNILNAFITGAIGAIVFSTLNVIAPAELVVPAAALVGMLAGVASLVPVVGMKLVYVPVALYLAARAALVVGAESLWFALLFFLVAFTIVDTIPDLIIRPYVSGRGLHVGAVMLAYTIGPLLFGWYGLFLMPLLLVLVFHFVRIVLPELIAGQPLNPSAVSADYSPAVAGEKREGSAATGRPPADTGADGGDERTEGGDGDPERDGGGADEPASGGSAAGDGEPSGR